MKTILRLQLVLAFVTLFNLCSLSQIIPELIFKNPVLISGADGQDGARYKFADVATGIDAIVEVKGRSASDVVLGSIDSAGIGWDKAFQPYLGIPNVGANREWWMEFKVEFVKAGTNNKKRVDKFFITGLDIDGDNGNLSEWAEMKKPTQLELSPLTSITTSLLGTIIDLLDLNNNGNDYRVNGPITNFNNIDTSATAVMATYMYEKKDKIEFKIGGKTNANGGSPGNVAMRMNSFWFKQFNITPDPILLPVELTSFTAMLGDKKVDLKWTTASEKNVSHFSVEKSTDGANYTQAGIVFAYGNTSENVQYAFPDNNINTSKEGVIYYRLRSVDIDGRSDLSIVRSIRIGKTNERAINIVTYPNPATSELRITIPASWQNQKITYELFNKEAQVTAKKVVAAGSQTEAMNLSGIAPGFYIVKVTCNGEVGKQKIIKR